MVSVYQVNLNKCKLANLEVSHIMNKETNSIFLITEPHMFRNKFSSLPAGYKVFGVENSRAIIASSVNMPIYMAYDLSTTDLTVCFLEQGNKKIFLVSLYCDINKEVISNHLLSAFETFKKDGSLAVICADSNAHSILWNCDSTNSRGRTS